MNEAQVGFKIAERNIKTLRYADDTTIMAEKKEELKAFQKGVRPKIMTKREMQTFLIT